MDEELGRYLAAMEARLMERLKNSEERIVDRLRALEQDLHNTKSFLIGEALATGGRWSDLEARVTKLEEGMGWR